MIPTLIGVAVLIFLLLRVMPGDVVEASSSAQGSQYVPQDLMDRGARQARPRQAALAAVRRLDGGARAPRLRASRCGPGRRSPRRSSSASRCRCSSPSWPALIAPLIAIPLGILAALKQDTWVDYAVRVFSIAGLATPSFWLGMPDDPGLLIVFKWVPPMVFTPIWVNPLGEPRAAHLAGAGGGLPLLAPWRTRMMRSTMLEVLREDYIRTARAKGLWTKLILTRHALKNAILPVLTVIGTRVRLPARRAGGDRAGVQPERPRHALRRGDLAPRLHDDPGAGAAGRDLLPDRQLRGRHRLRGGSTRASATASMAAAPQPSTRLTRATQPPGLARPRSPVSCGSGRSARSAPRSSSCIAVSPLAASWIAPYDPLADRLRRDARRAERGALARHRRLRPRRALAHHLRLAHRARRSASAPR